MNVNYLRMPTPANKAGHSRSQFYNKIKEGLMPPPVKIGVKSSAWAEHEIEAVNRARLAGQTDEQIRALVSRLVASRTQEVNQ